MAEQNNTAGNNQEPVKLWNPAVAARWSLLFSPLLGAVLHAKNWKAMGEHGKSKKAMAWAIGFLVAWLVMATQLSEAYAWLIHLFALVYLLVWYFVSAKSQIAEVQTRLGNQYQKKGWGMPIVTVTAFWFACGAMLFIFEAASEGNAAQRDDVRWIKQVELNACPSVTLETLVNGYMDKPRWKTGQSDDGESFVNISGYIEHDKKRTRALMQFVTDKEKGSIEYHALEFNDISQNRIMASALLEEMCKQATKKEEARKKSSQSPVLSSYQPDEVFLKSRLDDDNTMTVAKYVNDLQTLSLNDGSKPRILGWSKERNRYTLVMRFIDDEVVLLFIHDLSDRSKGKDTQLQYVEINDERISSGDFKLLIGFLRGGFINHITDN